MKDELITSLKLAIERIKLSSQHIPTDIEYYEDIKTIINNISNVDPNVPSFEEMTNLFCSCAGLKAICERSPRCAFITQNCNQVLIILKQIKELS